MSATTTASLDIGREQTSVTLASGQEPDRVVVGIGWESIARDYFKHSPPTPLELENAIAKVEDEIIPARARLAGRASVVTKDPGIRKIAALAGLPDVTPVVLDIDAVERTFNRLANVSLGSPAQRQGVPETPAFAATLLILREFMHHMGISSVIVQA